MCIRQARRDRSRNQTLNDNSNRSISLVSSGALCPEPKTLKRLSETMGFLVFPGPCVFRRPGPETKNNMGNQRYLMFPDPWLAPSRTGNVGKTYEPYVLCPEDRPATTLMFNTVKKNARGPYTLKRSRVLVGKKMEKDVINPKGWIIERKIHDFSRQPTCINFNV